MYMNIYNKFLIILYFTYTNSLNSLNYIINVPFDKGANIPGSKFAPVVLNNDLKKLNFDESSFVLNKEDMVDLYFEKVFKKCYDVLNDNNNPLIIGGDHSIAIPSIFASNKHCINNNEKLGVLWCDAHADFNTIKTSPSGNIHGVPVSVLCGHSLYSFQYSDILNTEQFLYYGLRDIDTLEFLRIQDYNMKIANSEKEILDWINNYDKIHLSFDMDCIDPKYFSSINTPVENGLSIKNIKSLFNIIKKSDKLLSMDLVEYNPVIGNQNKIIIELLKSII